MIRSVTSPSIRFSQQPGSRPSPPRSLRRRVALAAALATTALIPTALAVTALAPTALAAGDGDAGPPQRLPITARWCLSPSRCIDLEVPRGDRQFAWGLQLRPPLTPLRGMWFGYAVPTPVRFWMHRTPSPLDMLFVRDRRVIAIEARVAPCMRLPCRSYGPGVPVDGVLELAAGEAERLQIRVGTPVAITPLPAAPRPRAVPAARAPG